MQRPWPAPCTCCPRPQPHAKATYSSGQQVRDLLDQEGGQQHGVGDGFDERALEFVELAVFGVNRRLFLLLATLQRVGLAGLEVLTHRLAIARTPVLHVAGEQAIDVAEQLHGRARARPQRHGGIAECLPPSALELLLAGGRACLLRSRLRRLGCLPHHHLEPPRRNGIQLLLQLVWVRQAARHGSGL